MHPEADAFLDAIFDHPEDDTPRLVYADWLQEHGQANYAQFIRLQCAAAREKLWSDEANRLWEEIGRVWNRLDEEWWPATREGWGRWPWVWPYRMLLDAIHFERGLLRSDVLINAQQMRTYTACWAWLPACEICLSDLNDLKDCANMQVARRLRKIVLAWGADRGMPENERDSCLTHFASSPFTHKLQVLDLSQTSMRRAMVQSLLREKSFLELMELHIAFGDWSDCDPEETTKQLEARFELVVRH